MMRRLTRLTCLLALVLAAPAYAAAPQFVALCYHNIEDIDPDQTYEGVTTGKLVEQLSWLQHEGYRAVSLDDLLAARDGKKPLPKKAMLLTFDDGYESFYTRVYPILKAFHFPAVIGLVDTWMKGDANNPGDKVLYGGAPMARNFFLTWPQVKEMEDSGLVEVASHSHALHLGIPANPQGNLEPAAITTAYDPATHTYETRDAYIKRLKADAEASAAAIGQETGKKPRSIIWPYGTYNKEGIAVETAAGMPITLSLDDGFASVKKLMSIPRELVSNDPSIGEFVIDARQIGKLPPMRVVQVDLDYVYDDDAAQMARNLDQLVARIHDMQISAVFLQAFADPHGTGLAKQLYFPNRHLPMRADLFNRVAWQLKTRAKVMVFGWLPVLSYDLGKGIARVEAWDPASGKPAIDANADRRLSPFDPEARRTIIEIYEDLARHAPIDGLLFHDDAVLSDFEDASVPAMATYRMAGFPASVEAIRANPDLMKKWTNFKTRSLIAFTRQLADAAKKYRQPLITVRNIFAPVVSDPDSEVWFAQNYDLFLAAYDYIAIEAMPKMENIDDDNAEAWMQRLVVAASRRPEGLKHTIFELQSVDWRKDGDSEDHAIPTETLAAEMRFLAKQRALNFGYYPDDFVTNTPDAALLHWEFSLQAYPYKP
jgi:biofilm PGA synthesis lipoprotein PgaB